MLFHHNQNLTPEPHLKPYAGATSRTRAVESATAAVDLNLPLNVSIRTLNANSVKIKDI